MEESCHGRELLDREKHGQAVVAVLVDGGEVQRGQLAGRSAAGVRRGRQQGASVGEDMAESAGDDLQPWVGGMGALAAIGVVAFFVDDAVLAAESFFEIYAIHVRGPMRKGMQGKSCQRGFWLAQVASMDCGLVNPVGILLFFAVYWGREIFPESGPQRQFCPWGLFVFSKAR